LAKAEVGVVSGGRKIILVGKLSCGKEEKINEKYKV
jgi:hypothetical protein